MSEFAEQPTDVAAGGAGDPAGTAADAPESAAPPVDAEVVEADDRATPDVVEPVEAEPDYKDQWLRAAAELDNVRKRARRDAGLAESRGIARLARELLPALDNLDRALAAAEAQPENADHHLTDGIRLVQRDLLGSLERVGIVPDVPHGAVFDPHRHEAVAQQPADGIEPGTVTEVYSPGYLLGDEVLRAAKVVVAG